MKQILSLLSLMFFFSCGRDAQVASSNAIAMGIPSIDFYSLKTNTITGDLFTFSSLKGKRVLIVNTASRCGYTPQYEDLEQLYRIYGGDNFTIIGFPSNDFAWEEPGSDQEIAAFCKSRYDVTFPMMTKVKQAGVVGMKSINGCVTWKRMAWLMPG